MRQKKLRILLLSLIFTVFSVHSDTEQFLENALITPVVPFDQDIRESSLKYRGNFTRENVRLTRAEIANRYPYLSKSAQQRLVSSKLRNKD